MCEAEARCARTAPGSGRLGVRKKARLAVSSSSSSDDSSSIDTEEEEDAKPEPATKHEKDGNHSWVRNNKKAYKVWSGDRNTLCEHCERPRKNLTHTRLRTATGVSCFRCNIVFCFECVTVPAAFPRFVGVWERLPARGCGPGSGLEGERKQGEKKQGESTVGGGGGDDVPLGDQDRVRDPEDFIS